MRLIKDNVERIAEGENQIQKLKADGFKILDEKADVAEETRPELESLKIDELKSLAKEKGIEGAASLTKNELLSVLKDVV